MKLRLRSRRLGISLAVAASFAVFCFDLAGAQSKREIQKERSQIKVMVAHANEERPSLAEILQAQNVKILDDLVAAKPPSSRIGEIVYATRLYELNRKIGSLAVLCALPASDVEMEALLEFSAQEADSAFRDFPRSYYAAAFQSVIMHPEFLHSMFSVAGEFGTKEWADYDNIDWYCSNLAKVHDAIPAEYDRAVSKERSKDRVFLSACGQGH